MKLILFVFFMVLLTAFAIADTSAEDGLLIKKWCTHSVTIAQVEQEKEFGWTIRKESKEWLKFRGAFIAGDEILAYKSPHQSWEVLGGVQGYSIFRDGKLLADLPTLEN